MMKKLIVAATLSALALSLVACAPAATTPGTTTVALQRENDDTITVTGKAGMEATPDIAQVTIGVSSRANTPQAARQDNAQAMNATLDAILALGIEEKDIQTSNMNMYNTYGDYGTVTGYRMSTDLTITVRDITKAGEVVDAAIAAGSNELGGVKYLVSNRDELYNQALSDAVELARQKAEDLAAAAGKQVGMVKQITETSDAATTRRTYDMNADTGGASAERLKTVIQPGSTSIDAEVQVIFALLEPAVCGTVE